MSAAEVIELIKRLPPAEREEVRAFVQEVDGASAEPRRIDPARAKAIGQGVFDRHPELFRKLAQ